ncbi:MAG TPA: MATE family efflux transporter [Polyangiaceae bacterium]|nr:MATE family efflux transporter [Polyangiaceae bacterium]
MFGAIVHEEATTSGGAGRTERILRGPLAWEIARFGAPLALGMALQTTFNLVDAYILGQMPRDEVGPALGALGICDQIAALGTIVSYGISTAAGAVVAQRQGASDHRGVKRATWQSTLLVAALGAVFAVLGLAFAGPIMRGLIGAKGEVAVFGTSYLRVSVTGSFTMFFLLQLTAIQRALGSAKTPASLLVLGNVINVFLALLFVFGPGPAPSPFDALTGLASLLHIPRMGMLGAAWATVIARLVVLVPIAWVGVRRFRVGLPPRGQVRPDLGEMSRVLRIAWPTSAQFVLRIGAGLLVNSLVARYFTTATDQTATTAMGLVFRLDTMAIFIAMGWGSAAQTFVGQNLGAKLLARARRSGWLTAGYDAINNLLLVLLVLFAGERLLRLFDNDDAPVGIAMLYLVNVAPSYLGLGLGVVLGNAMAGAGATRTTLAVDAIVLLGVQTPLCVLAVATFHTDLAGLFRCVAATSWLGAALYVLVYVRVPWLSHTPEPAAPPSG